jgi:hypothetical protein
MPQSFQRRRPRRVSRLFTALVEGGPGTRRARHSTWQVSRSGGWRDQAAHCDDPCRMDVKGSLRRVPRRYKHCGLASAPREGCLRLHLASFRQARRPATDSQITSGQTSTGSLCGWGPCVRCRPIARNLTDLTSGSQRSSRKLILAFPSYGRLFAVLKYRNDSLARVPQKHCRSDHK